MSSSNPIFPKDTHHDEDDLELNLSDPSSRLAAARHHFDNQNGLSIQPISLGDKNFATYRMASSASSIAMPNSYVYSRPTGLMPSKPSDDEDEPSSVPSEPIHQLGEYKGVNISIEVSDTFVFDSPEMMRAALKGDIGPDDGAYIYSRSCNPTVAYLGSYLAAMEATEKAYCTSSGMSAITAVMMHLCKSGGRVVASKALYAGSYFLLNNFLAEQCKITTKFVDITNLDEVKDAIEEAKTDVLYFEPVSNPALIVADIAELCKIAHQEKVKVVVDNTLTPMIISPAELGADVVIHSLTKYVSGGADIIAGAICGKADLVDEMTSIKGGALIMIGSTMNPKEAFELLERFSHMSLRIKEQCNRAMEFAKRMKEELKLKVIYPGLKGHPQNKVFEKMKNEGYGFGAMLCVDMKTTKKAFDLVKNLKKQNFGFLAVSLGYYENLISCPGSLVSNPTQNPKKQGDISPGLVRMSIGYIGTFENKWKQFKKAYEAVSN